MRRRVLVPLTSVVAAGALVLSMSVGAGASVPASKAALCAGSTKKAAIKQIKKTWDIFLNGAGGYTNDQKKAVIENVDKNPELGAIFDRLQQQNAGAAATTAPKINSIKCVSKKKASVDYDLILGGQVNPDIITAPAEAVLVGKVWKISQQSYCDISTLGDPSLAESGPCAA
jgi:hypothetical protein